MKRYLFILAVLAAILLPAYSQNVRIANSLTYGRDRWVPLVTSNQVFNITNNLTEVVPISFTIPGGSMGANGALHITALMSTSVSNANAKMMIFHFGSAVLKRPSMATATSNKTSLDFYLFNRGAQNSQIAIPSGSGTTSWTAFSAVPSTFSVDTSVDQVFSIGLSNAVATDSLSLEQFSLRVLRKP